MTEDQRYLKAAADAALAQARNNPALGIPVDPEVAEFMGAFEENARNLEAAGETVEDGADEKKQ